jgi:hypothetical protein
VNTLFKIWGGLTALGWAAFFVTGCPSHRAAPAIERAPPAYSADRWDDAHPEEAGLIQATPDDSQEPEKFDAEGTGDL